MLSKEGEEISISLRRQPTVNEFLARKMSPDLRQGSGCCGQDPSVDDDSDLADSQASTVSCVSTDSPECTRTSGSGKCRLRTAVPGGLNLLQTPRQQITEELNEGREVASSLPRRPTVNEFLSRQASNASIAASQRGDCCGDQDPSGDDSTLADRQPPTYNITPRRPTVNEFLSRHASNASIAASQRGDCCGNQDPGDDSTLADNQTSICVGFASPESMKLSGRSHLTGGNLNRVNRKRCRSEEEARPVRRVLQLDDACVGMHCDIEDRMELTEEEGWLSKDDFEVVDDAESTAEQESPRKTCTEVDNGNRVEETSGKAKVDAHVVEGILRLSAMMDSESRDFESGEAGRFVVRAVEVLHAAAPSYRRQQQRQSMKHRTQRARELLVSGYPQSGKTIYAAAVSVAAKQLKLCTVVVTKTRSLSNQVARDLEERYFAKLPESERPVCECVRVWKDSPMRLRRRIKNCLVQNGVVVVNYHLSALSEVAWIVYELRGYGVACDIVLVKDESDEMPAGPDTAAGCALKVLEGTCSHRYGGLGRPPLIVHITSRPLSILLSKDIHIAASDWFWHRPAADYSAPHNLQPLHNTFLQEGELQRANGFWSDKVDLLYRDAHPECPAQQKPGVLVLDAVNPFVNTPDSSEDRAERILRRYPRFVVVRTWGLGGIAVRVAEGPWIDGQRLVSLVRAIKTERSHGSASAGPGSSGLSLLAECQRSGGPEATGAFAPQCSWEGGDADADAATRDSLPGHVGAAATVTGGLAREDDTCELTIAEVLECIDDEGDAAPSLRRPVVVLGFSRMLGETFRSSSRVPTHMLCLVPLNSSLQAVQSALGRASFHGRSLLLRHGHAAVRVVMPWRDWDAVRAAAFLTLLLNVMGLSRALSADAPSSSEMPVVRADGTPLPWKADVSAEKSGRRVGHERGKNAQRTLSFHPVPKDHLGGEDVSCIRGLRWAQEHDPLALSLSSKQAARWTQFCEHGRDKYLCDVPDCGWT